MVHVIFGFIGRWDGWREKGGFLSTGVFRSNDRGRFGLIELTVWHSTLFALAEDFIPLSPWSACSLRAGSPFLLGCPRWLSLQLISSGILFQDQFGRISSIRCLLNHGGLTSTRASSF